MLLELALSASLATSLDPCDFIADNPGVTLSPVQNCTTVSDPSFNLGESSFSRFRVQIDPDVEGTTITNAAIYAEVEPQPSADVYQFAAWPVCEVGGTLVDAGVGAFTRWWENDGWATVFDPYGGGTPLAISLTKTACLSPNTRAVVVYAGYTTQISEGEPGWENGEHSTAGLSASTPDGLVYGVMSTSGSITLHQDVCIGSYGSSLDFRNCWEAAFGNQNWGFALNMKAADGTTQSSYLVNWTSFYVNGEGVADYTRSLNYSVASTARTFDFLEVAVGVFGAGGPVWNYYPEGNPLRPEEGYPWSIAAYLLHDSDLDQVLYDPTFDGTGFLWPDGQCDTWDCVTSFCDGTGWDIVGWAQCLFDAEVAPDEMVRSMFESVQNWGWWQALDYGRLMGLSVGDRFNALGGQCRDYGVGAEGLFSGFSVDTCELPMQDTIRTIAGAFIAIMIAFALASWAVDFLKTGTVPNPFRRPAEEASS